MNWATNSMIVYANRLTFEPEDGPRQLVEVFAKWLSSNRNVPIRLNAEQLLKPELHIPLPNNAYITSNAHTDSDENHFLAYWLFGTGFPWNNVKYAE
jgi:hypothetical protein